MDTLASRLRREASYVINSRSVYLVYQTYGKACMAYELGGINKDEYFELNDLLVKGCLNNPEWRNYAYDK